MGVGLARGVVGVLVIVFGITPASALGARWSLLRSPNPEMPQGMLRGVACVSAQACTAVGSYTDVDGGQAPLAERWNGKRWAIQTVPRPPGRGLSRLSGVACASGGACTAVGESTNRTGVTVTLAERWNGARWTIQTTPKPRSSASDRFTAVSCPTAGACIAVGSYTDTDGTHPLAERWNGKGWTVQAIPGSGELSGVSCASARACTAVGNAGTPFAERWNGKRWTIQSTPDLQNSHQSLSWELSAVSCPSPRACTAVGNIYNMEAGQMVPLAERWNGKRWTSQSTADLPYPQDSELSGVSCVSPSDCVAVGDTGFGRGTLAERWNGKLWTAESTLSAPGAQESELSAVSCASARACTAAGDYRKTGVPQTLGEHRNGNRWAIQSTPNPPGAQDSKLAGVSCTAANACTAVGDHLNSAGVRVPLAERWNGKWWVIQTTDTPADSRSSTLSGISCAAASACAAVGNYIDSAGSTVALVERWDGERWTIQTTPSPAGGKDSKLASISCASASACTAVGSYTDSSGSTATLAERWDGKGWTIETAPFGIPFSGVSCASANTCAAVGTGRFEADVNIEALAARWNGNRWASQPTPNPRGAEFGSALSGVSCASGSACTAVGNYISNDGPTVTLVEHWNGRRWTIQATPNPPGLQVDEVLELSGVSCSSASVCMAVGDYSNGSTQLTLVERWAVASQPPAFTG